MSDTSTIALVSDPTKSGGAALSIGADFLKLSQHIFCSSTTLIQLFFCLYLSSTPFLGAHLLSEHEGGKMNWETAGGVGGDEAEEGVVLQRGADRAGCNEDQNACGRIGGG